MLNEQNEQKLLVDRLQSLLRKTNPYLPAKLFDTETSSVTGDTILSPEARANYSDEDIDKLIQEWSSFSVNLDDSIQDRARLSIADKTIAELRLVKAAFGQVFDSIDHSDEISKIEDYLFDYYDPSLYKAAIRQKIDLIDILPIGQPEIKTARAVLIDELTSLAGPLGENERKLEIPEQAVLDSVKEWLSLEYGSSLNDIDMYGDSSLLATDIKDVFEQSIQKVSELRDAGWTVEVIERKKNAVSTQANVKNIVISSQRVITPPNAKKLMIHEVLGHAFRSARAESLGNTIGASGTATYSHFEESFEVALEQCFDGKYDPERGINHYIATGMAVTGRQSKDTIIHVITSIKQIEKFVNGVTSEKIIEAQRLAGIQINRTFAGMTDVEIGIAHRQDINYLHGLDNAWRLLGYLVEANDLDAGMRWLLSAKFNPYSAEDRELVNVYTPMPHSLIDFFNIYEENKAI